jgi:hypothetical protein
MSESQSNLPPEILRAYKEAKERGLPDGWVCSIDVSESRPVRSDQVALGVIKRSLFVFVVVGTPSPHVDISGWQNV